MFVSSGCSPLLGWNSPPFWSVITTDDRYQTHITGLVTSEPLYLIVGLCSRIRGVLSGCFQPLQYASSCGATPGSSTRMIRHRPATVTTLNTPAWSRLDAGHLTAPPRWRPSQSYSPFTMPQERSKTRGASCLSATGCDCDEPELELEAQPL
jgi:hypothetical protein